MVRSVIGKRPEYFEAILQLRNVSEEVENYAHEEIKRGGVHIAKAVEMKKGLDIYLADNNFARALGKNLQQHFGGECLITSSLYGRKDGKEVYRLTILFRGVPFQKGEVVEFKGEEFFVKSMGKEILLQGTKTGKKLHLKYKEVEKIHKKKLTLS